MNSPKFALASFADPSNLFKFSLPRFCKFGAISACEFGIFFALKFIPAKPSRSLNLLKFDPFLPEPHVKFTASSP